MVLALAALVHLSCAPVASAQPLPPGPEEAALEGLRRQEERARQQIQQSQPKADVLKPDEAPPDDVLLPAETPCFLVRAVQIEGPEAEKFSWLASEASPWLNQCLGVKGLSRVAAKLDGRLLARGFATTRVSLPAQNLQTGLLRITLHVGRVAELRMVEADTPAPGREDERWGTWRNAFPVTAGDVLDIRDIEQGVEQMKRLPSQQVATRLEPGEQPDTSIVFIERKAGTLRERLRGGVTLDNSGGQTLGRAQMSANLALDNPGGLNDVVSVSFNSNARRPRQDHRSQSVSLNYSVPWGYNLFSVNASHSQFAQTVQGTTAQFLSSGNSESGEARLTRTVWRSASGKLGVHAAISVRRAKSYLDDTEILVQRRRTTNAEVGVSYKHLFESASVDAELIYRRGVPWRAAQEDLVSAQDGGLTLRPRIWSFNAGFATDFSAAGRPVQYSATLRGQATGNTTLSIDQIAIGGRSSVRGFNGDTVLMAENGLILRNEFSTPLPPWAGVQANALLAIDYGRVWGASDSLLPGKQLAGLAVGLRGRRGAMQFEALLATPLHKPQRLQTPRTSLYFALTQSF